MERAGIPLRRTVLHKRNKDSMAMAGKRKRGDLIIAAGLLRASLDEAGDGDNCAINVLSGMSGRRLGLEVISPVCQARRAAQRVRGWRM